MRRQHPQARTLRGWMAAGLILCLTCTAAAHVHTVARMVTGSGGEPLAAGDLRLRATVGEGVAGPAAPAGGLRLTSGFWAGVPQPFDVYLPVVNRE